MKKHNLFYKGPKVPGEGEETEEAAADGGTESGNGGGENGEGAEAGEGEE